MGNIVEQKFLNDLKNGIFFREDATELFEIRYNA